MTTTNVKASQLNYNKYTSDKYDQDIVNSIPFHREIHDEMVEFIGKFDIILTNPPFGTKIKDEGIDMQIISQAIKYLKPNGKMYSFHKTSTVVVIL